MTTIQADPTHYLIAVEKGVPHLVATYDALDWMKGTYEQEVLTDQARAAGKPASELWYGLRQIDDVQGLVQRALAAEEAPTPQSPEPAVKRVPTRTVEGVKLISRGERYWLSEDGTWEIGYMDDYVTECDAPHPVKVSKLNRQWYESLSDHEKAHVTPPELRWALQDHKRGYYCYGGEIHYYALWHVVNVPSGDVIGRGDTFGEVLDMLGNHLRTGKTFD